MTKYILAHDIGTSGNKATLISQDGILVRSCVCGYETEYFNGIWAEQDSSDWWQAICQTSRDIIADTRIDPADIAAVCFSGQMMGCLCVDKNGVPLRKSIIWADQRSHKQEFQISQHISQMDFYRITGHRNSASYGLHKLMWIRDNQPEIYENTYKILNAKDYIVFCLTGEFCTDFSDASSNNCLDINTWKWSERIVEYAKIDIEKLPDIKPSTHVVGGVTKRAAEQSGLLEGTPVVLGGGDGMCASIGAGSYKEGRTFSYIGSSAWIATTSEKPIFDEEMRTISWAHIVPGMYAPNGTMQTAGGAFSWIKNTICQFEIDVAQKKNKNVYDIINQEICKSKPGSNGIVFLPYLLGERAPRWNRDAKGAFIGLKMQNNRSDMLRSVIEGVTLNMSIILDTLRKQVDITEMLVIGGGAKGEIWRQIMADIYKVKIKVPTLLEEATSIGAAVTGGVGVGLFKDFSVVDDFINIECEINPDERYFNIYKNSKKIFDQSYYALEKVFASMTQVYEQENDL